jgi:hypothetical protein
LEEEDVEPGIGWVRNGVSPLMRSIFSSSVIFARRSSTRFSTAWGLLPTNCAETKTLVERKAAAMRRRLVMALGWHIGIRTTPV